MVAGTAQASQVDAEDLWPLLIHSHQQHPQITDRQFLLSVDHFSQEKERELTLAAYQQDPKRTFCRFPARLTYLASLGEVKLAADRFTHCPQLTEFVNQVPFHRLELVYASEVLASATSMMGHIFLKASGTNAQGIEVAHTLAYFTEITTLNPAKLIVDSTMTGMPGFFIVRPFAEDLRQYRDEEQRNLWQFALKGSAERLELLQLHIWELHQIEITYYFQSFNCATLTLEMLALLAPEVLQERGLIVSPSDVVKAAKRHHLITQTHVETAPHWLYSALRDSQNSAEQRQVDDWLDQAMKHGNYQLAPSMTAQPLTALTLSTAITRAVALQQLDAAQAATVLAQLPTPRDTALDLSHYKHPAATPQDAEIAVAFNHHAGRNEALLTYIPAGHRLMSDNRQYLAEAELVIAKTTLRLDSIQKQVRLHEFTAYAVQSLSPDSALYPVWSGEFYLGYRPTYDAQFSQRSLGELSGAGGKSWRPHHDIMMYTLAGAGLATSLRDSRVFGYGKTGVLINMVGDLKWQLQYDFNTGKTEGDSQHQQITSTLSWFVDIKHTLGLQFERTFMNSAVHQQLGFSYHYAF